MCNSKIIGANAEKAACIFLQQQKLKLIAKNFNCKLGEIDLIMREKNTFVFTEVRMRNNKYYTSGLESITVSKQRKISKTALFYLQKNHMLDKVDTRFDVIIVDYINNQYQFNWLKNAFLALA